MAFSDASISKLNQFVATLGRCSSEIPGDMENLNELIGDINMLIGDRLAGLNQNVVHYLAIALKAIYANSAAAFPDVSTPELVQAMITKITQIVSDPDYVTAVATNAIVE